MPRWSRPKNRRSNGSSRICERSMKAISVHDKGTLAAFLCRNAPLHVYSIGDLDDFFWPSTTWYGLEGHAGLEEVVLIYSGVGPPVLLAITESAVDRMRELLQ